MIEKELLLTARRNLPEHLRVLAEKYPATSWQTHPNFSDLASFWLERHSMFREVIKRIKVNRPQFAGGSKVSMDGAYGKKQQS